MRKLFVLFFIFISLLVAGCKDNTYDVTQPASQQSSGGLLSQGVCGDSKCENGENPQSCCMDCGCPSGFKCQNNACSELETCGNGACGNGETKANCCKDCGCDYGQSCTNNICKSSCGDGIKASDETSENCCLDAGCSTGETCQNNKCIELKPVLNAYFTQKYSKTNSPSVTYLKAKGDVGSIVLNNIGNDAAKNVKIILSSPSGYFADKSIAIPSIKKNDADVENIQLNFLEKALDVTTGEETTINAKIYYENGANQQYQDETSFKLNIQGRNYMSWNEPKMIASWVTPTQPTIKEFASKSTSGLAAGMDNSDPVVQLMAARWLFEGMRAYGVNYVNDAHTSGDYVQFPIETLNNKAGDCEDNAVLYASLLEAIGLKSFLVLIPGHVFAGYINSEGVSIPIETTANNFDSAISSGRTKFLESLDGLNSGETTIIKPTDSWRTYPQVNLPEKNRMNLPSITKIKGVCKLSLSLSQGVVVKAPVTFTNSGNAPGAGCAAIIVYNSDGKKIDDDIKCWTINPGIIKQEDYIADIGLGNTFSGYYCSVI